MCVLACMNQGKHCAMQQETLPAARITLLPQAQALQRHGQDAVAEQGQQVLKLWAKLHDLAHSWHIPRF